MNLRIFAGDILRQSTSGSTLAGMEASFNQLETKIGIVEAAAVEVRYEATGVDTVRTAGASSGQSSMT